MNEYLVKTLKEGRLHKGLKQSDVAEIVGVKANTLSNYENGVSEPDIDTFANLCEIYELDFAYVLGEAYGLCVSGTDFDIKPSEIEHIKKYRDLDDHGKEMVDFTLQKEWERSTVVCGNVVSYSASPKAARNNYINEPGEVEKTYEDLSSLKRPE